MSPPDAKRWPLPQGPPLELTADDAGNVKDTAPVYDPERQLACMMSCAAHRCPFVCLYATTDRGAP